MLLSNFPGLVLHREVNSSLTDRSQSRFSVHLNCRNSILRSAEHDDDEKNDSFYFCGGRYHLLIDNAIVKTHTTNPLKPGWVAHRSFPPNLKKPRLRARARSLSSFTSQTPRMMNFTPHVKHESCTSTYAPQKSTTAGYATLIMSTGHSHRWHKLPKGSTRRVGNARRPIS